jgi:hypothetical protein
MKELFLIVCILGLVLGQEVNVSKTVTANITVNVRVWGVQYVSKGIIIIDANANGLYLSIFGDNPQNPFHNLDIVMVVHPNSNQSVTTWLVDTGVCTFEGGYNSSDIPPLTVPPTAKYIGKRDVRGLNCDVWRMVTPYKYVDYCEVMIANGNIQLIEGYYSGGALGAYFYVNVFGQDNSVPSLGRFAVPNGC